MNEGLVVRAANHSAVLGGQPCQRVADRLPVCHEIHHPGGTPIPFAAAVISTTLPIRRVTTRFGNDMVLVSYQHPGPLRWAAVEARKWARVRLGPRNFLDAVSSSVSMGLGATDRSCRLLP